MCEYKNGDAVANRARRFNMSVNFWFVCQYAISEPESVLLNVLEQHV